MRNLACDRFEKRITKKALKAKMKPHWVPQLDQATGATYYLNIKTAKTQVRLPCSGDEN